MPDMIFPTQQSKDGLGTVNTLDTDAIRSALAAIAENRSAGKMPPELLEHFKSKSKSRKDESNDDDSDEKDDEESDEENDDDSKEDDKKHDDKKHTDYKFIKKALDHMDNMISGSTEKCICGDLDCEECNPRLHRAPKASSENRIVRFTDADLTAEAVQRDVDAGNTEMVRARLAARQERRQRLASRVASATTEQIQRQARLAQRSDYRKKIVADVSATTRVAKKVIESVASYKNPAQMNKAEKNLIASRLASTNEFPIEFIEAALTSEYQKTAEENAGKEILASNISIGTKKVAMKQIVAKLSPESRQHAIDYWINTLGYGDQEWVRDLFSADLDS